MNRSDITQLGCTLILVLSAVASTYQSVLAMHDSHLDVNTWIASDNVTQLNTIDLNRGPISPSTTTAGATSADGVEDPTTGVVPPAGDEEGQDTDTVTDTEEEEEQDDGDEGNDDEGEED